MARRYVTVRPRSDDARWWDAVATDYLARTVFENDDAVDTGLLDSGGNKLLAVNQLDPIGFIRWRT